MFGVKSCSRNTFTRIEIVSKKESVVREHPRMDLIMIPQKVGMKDGAFTSVRWLWHTRGVIATPNHPTNVGGDNSVVHMLWHISSGVVVKPLSQTTTCRLTSLDTVACPMCCCCHLNHASAVWWTEQNRRISPTVSYCFSVCTSFVTKHSLDATQVGWTCWSSRGQFWFHRNWIGNYRGPEKPYRHEGSLVMKFHT